MDNHTIINQHYFIFLPTDIAVSITDGTFGWDEQIGACLKK